MASQKPSVPKGTRDFSPEEMVRRNYIFDTIRSVFKKYGYQPIETPAMENTETLMGKYGEEGDRLIFKILDSGDYISKVPFTKELNQTREKMTALSTASMNTKEEVLNEFESLTGLLLRWVDIGLSSHKLTGYISEKALRYDLTVPFARYVVQHQNEITFPFKRYQIQPVWRADRPQKGRYREFYQCDADVIGSDSLINEVELVQMMDEVFKALKVPVTIKINNRKILAGIAEYVGEKERLVDIVVAIDKYEKIGDKIYEELKQKEFNEDVINKLKNFMSQALEGQKLAGENKGKSALAYLRKTFEGIEIGQKGVDEIETIFSYFDQLNEDKSRLPNLVLDIALARGLNYYTGAIFEVKANAGTLTSSITGGGRYDDLTGIFGLPGLSGVGISFGADRIYDVLNELNLYPESVTAGTRLLFANFGGEDEMHCLKLLRQVRAAGISAEIYPDAVKMGKQFKYADAKKIPFVAIIGENERKGGFVTLKNMTTGEQLPVNENELIHKVE